MSAPEIAIAFFAGDEVPVPPGELHVREKRLRPGVGLPGRVELAKAVLEHGVDAFEHGEAPIAKVLVPGDGLRPTLDDVLAATFVQKLLAGEKLPEGAAVFAEYVALQREGHQPGASIPLERSLEATFLAIRNVHGGQLSVSENAARFMAAWKKMGDLILSAASDGVDPFSVALFPKPQFMREHLFLAKDRDFYRQDVTAGERWVVEIPRGAAAVSGLILRQPRSLLFKQWSRRDPDAPVGGAYSFLGVQWSETEWVFTTDPILRLSIAGLGHELDAAERKKTGSSDPFWLDKYDGTLVAHRRQHTALAAAEVVEIARRWTGAKGGRKTVVLQESHVPPPFAPYEGSEPFLFVSYSHRDKAAVYAEITALHEQGFRVWYDQGIVGGADWTSTLETKLKESSFVLIFLSPEAVESPNVRDEIHFALEKKKPLLAVHLVETDLRHGLEFRLNRMQALLKHKTPGEEYRANLAKALPAPLRGPRS
jgi:hypothetical protein